MPDRKPNAAAEARERDADAVRRTLDGDLTAFDRLIEVHQRRAVAVAYRLLGNIDDAMDVCQDAFVRGLPGRWRHSRTPPGLAAGSCGLSATGR